MRTPRSSGCSRLGLHPWVTAVERPLWIRIRANAVSGRATPKAG